MYKGVEIFVLICFFLLLLGASISDVLYLYVSNKYWACIWLLGFLRLVSQPKINWMEYAVGFLIISMPLCALTMCVHGAFGGADIKMMAVCGALLGPSIIVSSFFVGLFLAGGMGIICIIKRRKGGITIPVIPFFSLGIMITILL